jgi:CheY-like chemotaxis protein
MADMSPKLLSGVSVLVVEDNEDALEILSTVLSLHGAIVTATVSAREALEHLASVRPDVIVSDLAMPEMTGLQLIEKVHALPSQIEWPTPALAMTAYTQDEYRSQALNHGFMAFLPKPMDPKTLVQEVGRLAGRTS